MSPYSRFSSTVDPMPRDLEVVGLISDETQCSILDYFSHISCFLPFKHCIFELNRSDVP